MTFIPISFLLFAIPLPYFIDAFLTLRLQLVSSELGVLLIRMFRDSPSTSMGISSTWETTSFKLLRRVADYGIFILCSSQLSRSLPISGTALGSAPWYSCPLFRLPSV